MESQSDLIIQVHEFPQGNSDKELYSLISRLDSGEWLIPTFQRGFCWNKPQIIGWIQSIISHKAIGVIATYQLKGGGPVYIADGVQRLTASRYFIDDPEIYGYKFGSKQAQSYCESFQVTVQHRIYEDHREAMEAFQRLNRGTALTSYEFYKGELSLTNSGKLIGESTPFIVEKYETRLLKLNGKKNRAKEHQRMRDSYGLFLQYASESDTLEFWDTSSLDANGNYERGKIVEIALSDYLQGIKSNEIENKLYDFEKFIAEQISEIETVLDECGGKGSAVSPTALRWLLHLSIWRKNTKRPVNLYEEFIRKLFTFQLEKYHRITSRIELQGDPIVTVTLSVGGLNHLPSMCRALDSELYQGRTRRKKTAAAGYHNSHKNPFKEDGNNDTFFESGLRNIARGSNSVKGLIGGASAQFPLAP